MNKDIVEAFQESFHQLETAFLKLETLRRRGEEILSEQECIDIDNELTALNAYMAKSWTVLADLRKKATPAKELVAP